MSLVKPTEFKWAKRVTVRVLSGMWLAFFPIGISSVQAETEDPHAQALLALAKINGQLAPVDLPFAYNLVQKLSRSGEPLGLFLLCQATAYGRSSDSDGFAPEQLCSMALPGLETRAAAGDIHAMYALGVIYRMGLGAEENLETSLKWLNLASEQGQADASFVLADMYESAQIASVNDATREAKVMTLYLKAAELNHAPAQYRLGNMYQERGALSLNADADGEPDFKQAEHWFRQSAQRGWLEAQKRLGINLFSGESKVEGCQWFELAAAQGDRDSQSAVGDCYRIGKGKKQDLSQALKWYQRAANKGDANAMYYLAQILREGTQANPSEALKWFHKAAQAGHSRSFYELGIMYRDGVGTTRNRKLAISWLKKAATKADFDLEAAELARVALEALK